MWKRLLFYALILGLIVLAAQTLHALLPLILCGGIIYALIVNPQFVLGTTAMLVIGLALYRFPILLLLLSLGIGLLVVKQHR
ncbi:MAG: hypothetical protein E2598_05555 [Sphingobium sp.]|nr:hypothetical protein [Sphingobium sp.]